MSHPSTSKVPDRTLSLAFINSRQVRLRQSRAELKGKLSKVSFGSSPLEHTRLKIEDIEAERDELRLENRRLGLEMRDKQWTGLQYRQKLKKSNQRVVSLGETLWEQSKKLRKLEEDLGLVAKLGPDSKGAYVATLLALYKDPTKTNKRDGTLRSTMKATAVKVYEVRKDAPRKNQIYCVISRGWFDYEDMNAGYIVSRRIGPEAFEYVFGNGSGSRLDTSDNCLLMHRTVERNMDNGNFVLVPVEPSERPIKRWKIRMTNSAALDVSMGSKQLKDLHDKEVDFKNDARPAARFLYFHFLISLLRNRRDQQPGWEEFALDLISGRPFASAGPYLRDSMLLSLARAGGGLDEETERGLLGSEGTETFTEKEKLSSREEEEIARRAILSYDETDEEVDESSEDLENDLDLETH